MTEYVKCSKCGSARAWLERDAFGLMLRCLCGLARPVVQKADGNTTILHSVVRVSEVALPQPGTKTKRCLMAVFAAWPTPISTARVAEDSRLEGKETSALLMTLLARGLVERVSERRGLLGGSEWLVTIAAREALRL